MGKNKKRWSRKMRKMMKIGKVQPKESVLNRDTAPEKFSSKEKGGIDDSLKLSTDKPSAKTVPAFESEEKRKKYEEINSHLKTVFGTSLICIAILFSLFFLEGKNHWVEKTNSGIKTFLANWNWKL